MGKSCPLSYVRRAFQADSSTELHMIDPLRRIQRYRRTLIVGALAATCAGVVPSRTIAQSGSALGLTAATVERSAAHAELSGSAGTDGVITSPSTLSLLPTPGSVLDPNNRRNTPGIKIGIRAGINRSAYSNDRYLNNVPLDVGDVSGETDIYSSAAGFGYSVGGDLEYPLNQAVSILGTLQYDHVAFGSEGAVREPCVRPDGSKVDGNSIHDFRATMDFIKLAGSMKLTFSTWYLTAGLSAGHPISTSLDRTRRLGGTDCYFPESGGKQVLEEHGPIPAAQRLHYSLRLGGGIIYHLTEKLQFSPEITLDFGFNAINKSPDSDLGVYGISATVRYNLR